MRIFLESQEITNEGTSITVRDGLIQDQRAAF